MLNALRSHTQWAYILTRFGKVIPLMNDDKVKVVIVRTLAQAER